MNTALVIIHSILAVFLLGAVTHQTLAVWWRVPAGPQNFFDRFRAVRAAGYANAIVALFLLTACLGAYLYPVYRISVRIVLEDLRRYTPVGLFEAKEHLVAIGLGVLPAYWFYWRRRELDRHVLTRKMLTLMLALIVWAAFLVGHIINNIRGFA